jgi:hypothetical protein
MGIECGECERDLRGGHDDNCSRNRPVMTNDYIAAQPAPKQDANAAPIWPLVVKDLDETFAEAAKVCRAAGEPGVTAKEKIITLVRTDMLARHEFGLAKHGNPLVAENGRDHLADALQEALDGAVYLRAEIEKRGGLPACVNKGKICKVYADQIVAALEIRELIFERDGR